jgi:hypothetical protein
MMIPPLISPIPRVDLEQFQEKCETVFRPGLRQKQRGRAVRRFRENDESLWSRECATAQHRARPVHRADAHLLDTSEMAIEAAFLAASDDVLAKRDKA